MNQNSWQLIAILISYAWLNCFLKILLTLLSIYILFHLLFLENIIVNQPVKIDLFQLIVIYTMYSVGFNTASHVLQLHRAFCCAVFAGIDWWSNKSAFHGNAF